VLRVGAVDIRGIDLRMARASRRERQTPSVRTEGQRIEFLERLRKGVPSLAGRDIPEFDRPVAAGVGLVPEDRKAFGLVLGASVEDNLGYATLMSSARYGLVDRRGQAKRASAVAERLAVRMRGLGQQVGALSGGNQQKVVLGRWISAGSRVLILDEPTRGVDVGAKVEIYQLMNEITAAGGAVVMVSSELPEVLGMSDRILVMSDGRVAGVLAAADADQHTVMSLAVKEVESDRA